MRRRDFLLAAGGAFVAYQTEKGRQANRKTAEYMRYLVSAFQNDEALHNILLTSIVAAFIYFFISKHFQSWRTGLLTALVCIAMPRVTGQLQIGDTDTGIGDRDHNVLSVTGD